MNLQANPLPQSSKMNYYSKKSFKLLLFCYSSTDFDDFFNNKKHISFRLRATNSIVNFSFLSIIPYCLWQHNLQNYIKRSACKSFPGKLGEPLLWQESNGGQLFFFGIDFANGSQVEKPFKKPYFTVSRFFSLTSIQFW